MGNTTLKYTGHIVAALEELEEFISHIPEVVAEEALYSSVFDEPRPPIRTGLLRQSGHVYIGGQLFLTTSELAGKRPKISSLLSSSSEYAKTAPWDSHSILGIGSVKTTGGHVPVGVHSHISVEYTAPHALLMHEWGGGFSDAQSGDHYLSSKGGQIARRSALKLRVLWKQKHPKHRMGVNGSPSVAVYVRTQRNAAKQEALRTERKAADFNTVFTAGR